VIDFGPENHPMVTSSDALTYLNNLQVDWDARVNSSPRVRQAPDDSSRSTYAHQELALLLMEQCRTAQARQRIVEVLRFDQLPALADEVAFDMAWILAHGRDRENLVSLLSVRCPPIAGRRNIESLMVEQSRIPDGLLVLCDAFDASSVASVRTELARALRRALSPLGIDDPDDQNMVRASRQWFMPHKDKVKPNLEYEPDGPE
jgi:hypothetical protein